MGAIGVSAACNLPLIGVDAFLPREHGGDIFIVIELIHSAEVEKGQQISNMAVYQTLRYTPEWLEYLQNTARDRVNVFAALLEAAKTHSLGQISQALYEVNGECRRIMSGERPRTQALSARAH